MYSKQLTIGLFGFGVVGEGIYKVLQQTPTLNANVKKICIKHPEKKRNAPASLFTTKADVLLDDPDINLIVELIDDADEAFKIVRKALANRKAVVSANKKMIAEHLADLLRLQHEHETSFLYEAAVCGSIPIIRNLEEYYDNDLLQSLCGIVNGSTNYILTRIKEDKLTYGEALLEAQQAGFAESNPALDVEGVDAVNKLTILLAHAYGIITAPQQLLYKGITQLHDRDSTFAAEKGFEIKLTAQARQLSNGKIAAFVLPQFVTPDSQLFSVKNEYNGIVIESKLADKQFLYGKGAGRYPTSSAVLSDIAALRYDYKYEYRKLCNPEKLSLTKNYYLRVYVSFENWEDLRKEDFETIEEFYSSRNRQYLIGLIQVEKLKEATWLQSPQVSVIVWPNGIVENGVLELKAVKAKSLRLASVV